MQRVTDFRIDTIEIDEAKLYRLPEHIQRHIQTFARWRKCGRPGYVRFELPAYRTDELNQLLKALEA